MCGVPMGFTSYGHSLKMGMEIVPLFLNADVTME